MLCLLTPQGKAQGSARLVTATPSPAAQAKVRTGESQEPLWHTHCWRCSLAVLDHQALGPPIRERPWLSPGGGLPVKRAPPTSEDLLPPRATPSLPISPAAGEGVEEILMVRI
jgi:hypothetical protein